MLFRSRLSGLLTLATIALKGGAVKCWNEMAAGPCFEAEEHRQSTFEVIEENNFRNNFFFLHQKRTAYSS